MKNTSQINRRNFLKFGAGAAVAGAALSMPTTLLAASQKISGPRTLNFFNTHTGQHHSATYWSDNQYDQDQLMQLNYLLRDHRQNEAAIMDCNLFDQMWELQQLIGGDDEFHIISGYRSPKTNALLRRNSSGVAKKSYHMQGRAIDLRLPGIATTKVREAALSLKAGGVGYYRGSDFVHLDTGPARNWRSA